MIISLMVLLVPGFDDSVPTTDDKIFKIETSPDIVESIKVQSDESFDLWGFDIVLKQNSEGMLEVKIPKNLPTPASFTNSWHYDERPIILADGIEIDYDVILDPCYSYYKIPIDGKTDLEIVYTVILTGSWQLYSPVQFDENHSCYNKVFNEQLTESPLQQLKSGVPVDEIRCKENLVLIQKHDDSPACVFIGTYSKLVERGWAKYDESFLDFYRSQILYKLREGPQNVSGIFKNFLVSEALKEKTLDDILSDAYYQVNCCTYSLDGNSYPYPLSIGITFLIDQKQMTATAEYDLQQEKITGIETSPIRKSGVMSFSNTKSNDTFTTLEPNTVEFFYYPDSTPTKDNYKLFMLIRLPEWMGGAENNVSAFRAYSAKALDDPCIIKYWGDEGRQRIENPCQGGMYRVIDGALTYGATHRSTAMTALPYLDLSMDENGMLSVEPPNFTKDENGVIGYGRDMTLSDLRKGSEFLVESFAKHYPIYPTIPIDFAGYLLSEITPDNNYTVVKYLDFQSKSGDITMTISKTRQHDYDYNYNFAESDKEFWQIGNTVIKVGGTALDKNSNRPEHFQTYLVHFNDGNNYFAIEGKNIEFIKKEIVRNYFPEYSYDDMFLVSSTVEK